VKVETFLSSRLRKDVQILLLLHQEEDDEYNSSTFLLSSLRTSNTRFTLLAEPWPASDRTLLVLLYFCCCCCHGLVFYYARKGLATQGPDFIREPSFSAWQKDAVVTTGQ
jgi:hypothetical protein